MKSSSLINRSTSLLLRRASRLALALASTLALVSAHAQSDPITGSAGARTSMTVTMPNGYASLSADDMKLMSVAGEVRWMRRWDGYEWKFNPQWESLSQSWKNLTGSQAADTTAGTVTGAAGGVQSASSSGGSGGTCWVWVDEAYSAQLVLGSVEAPPMVPARSTPFNRVMGENSQDYAPAQSVGVDYAALCPGVAIASGSSYRNTEGIRRINELYLGDEGRYAFSNRSILEKRTVSQLPAQDAASLYASLAQGQITLAPVSNPKGFRWVDRGGDRIDYNTQGQVVSYADRNENTVWLARDTGGRVLGAVDANGRVLFSLHYNGELLVEVKDYPIAGVGGDLPARSVKYQYDAKNRLTQVTDARGNTVIYNYDGGNHIVKITDQERRSENLAYKGDLIKQRTAADGAITDYKFAYDDTNKQFSSKITGPETSAGRRVEDYTYNRVGKLVRQIVNGRTDAEVRYDTGSRSESSTNARGFVTKITRNEFDQVTEVANPDGTSVKQAYSALHLQLTEITDELGVKTQYQYDSKGNLLKKIEAAGTTEERTTEYTRNNLGQLSQINRKGRTESSGTVTPDAIWLIEYDSQGQIKKATDPEGNVRRYAYDRAGNLAQYTDARGNATRYERDAVGNLSKITDALARVRSYQYDKVGNQTAAIDARGKSMQMAYDALNRWLQSTNPVGGVFKMQYNAQGYPVQQTDEDGRTSRAEFDNFLRVSKQIDGLGNVTEYSYNIADGSAAGALGALYEPAEIKYPTFTQRQRYDQRERTTAETLLNPNSKGIEGLDSGRVFDKRGQVISETDANGKTRFFAYDAIGQLTEIADSLGNKTKAQYDVRGNLIQIVDAKGNVNKFEFDRNDRKVKEILPLGQTTVYQYDEADNVTALTDPNGNKATYTFDAVNRLKEAKRYKAGNVLARTTSYTWDDTDNLTAWSDTDATRPTGLQTSSGIATYDDDSRKTSETITYPAGNSLSYGYAYSAAGLKNQLTWADGTVIGYGYSAHGELASVTIPGEGEISVNEFKWDEPAKITLPGGVTRERTLDGLLNLEGLKVKTPGQQTVLALANGFGKVQELKTSNRTDTAANLSTTKNSSYTYDDEIRLTQAITDTGGLFGTDTENFTLDAVGNRIAHSRVNGAWTYDANNRLSQRGTGGNATTYQYDESGNLTQKTEPGNKITQYAYDTQNRLIEVKDGANNPIARYGYDPVDRRLWKEQYRDKDGNALTQAKRTAYLYADEGLIAEASQDISLNADNTVTASGSVVITNQYGPRPDGDFTTEVMFAKTKNSNGQDSVAYYHHDQLGTPIQATDKAGNVVWAAAYNVFGQAQITTPIPTTDKPTISSSLRFPGQIEDPETGLHYNYRRYYDPATGRYITQDPIGLAGGDNPYRYVEADPVNIKDPTGECPMCVAFAVCMASCGLTTVGENLITGDCNNWGDTAKNCAVGCVAGMGLGLLAGKSFGWAKKALQRSCNNSFPADTLVHVKPNAAAAYEAQQAITVLKPIGALQVGDEVLAQSDWKTRGQALNADERLSYEKISDIFTSSKLQTLVHITLNNGETIQATEGHPFKTTDGWRDAVMLKKGGQLLLKGGAGSDEPDSQANQPLARAQYAQTANESVAAEARQADEYVATIRDIRIETNTLPVFNLEVANAHTFFVGVDGAVVHNGICTLPKVPGGKGSVPPDKRDKKRYFDRKQVDEKLKENNGKCIGCGDKLDLKDAKGHHRDRHANGGRTIPENLDPLCPGCHTTVHSK